MTTYTVEITEPIGEAQPLIAQGITAAMAQEMERR